MYKNRFFNWTGYLFLAPGSAPVNLTAEAQSASSILVKWQVSSLTLFLLKPKVISLCHQYRARPACTYCSLTRLYTVGWTSFHLDIPKNDNGQCQNWEVDYSI